MPVKYIEAMFYIFFVIPLVLFCIYFVLAAERMQEEEDERNGQQG